MFPATAAATAAAPAAPAPSLFLHQPVIGPNACLASPLVELHHTGHTQRIALTFWIGT